MATSFNCPHCKTKHTFKECGILPGMYITATVNCKNCNKDFDVDITYPTSRKFLLFKRYQQKIHTKGR